MARKYRINRKRIVTGAEVTAFAMRYLKSRTSINRGHTVEEKLDSEKQ